MSATARAVDGIPQTPVTKKSRSSDELTMPPKPERVSTMRHGGLSSVNPSEAAASAGQAKTARPTALITEKCFIPSSRAPKRNVRAVFGAADWPKKAIPGSIGKSRPIGRGSGTKFPTSGTGPDGAGLTAPRGPVTKPQTFLFRGFSPPAALGVLPRSAGGFSWGGRMRIRLLVVAMLAALLVPAPAAAQGDGRIRGRS